MAPLPRNNTAIYSVTYTTGVHQHTMSVRYDGNLVSLDDVRADVLELITVLAPGLCSEFNFISARNQGEGEDFSLPADTPGLTPNVGGNTLGDVEAPISHTFVGRTNGGRRNVLPIFGYTLPIQPDYKVGRGDNNELDDALDFLQGTATTPATPGVWVGIDGQATTWYNRVTQTYNDYWIRQQRR